MQALNDLLWSRVLIVALLAIGLVLSIRSRWVQFRYFGTFSAFYAMDVAAKATISVPFKPLC